MSNLEVRFSGDWKDGDWLVEQFGSFPAKTVL